MGSDDRYASYDGCFAVLAFVGVTFVALIISVTTLVGTTELQPRQALLLCLLPSAVVGLVVARARSLRRFFGKLFMIG